MAEYEYGSRDSWNIRSKGRRERNKEEASRREDGGEESHEPKMNGKQFVKPIILCKILLEQAEVSGAQIWCPHFGGNLIHFSMYTNVAGAIDNIPVS